MLKMLRDSNLASALDNGICASLWFFSFFFETYMKDCEGNL